MADFYQLCYDCGAEIASELDQFCRACGRGIHESETAAIPVKVAWWRWLLIPVAAVLGFALAQLLAFLVGSILPDRGAQLVSAFMTPIGFVVLGTWMVSVRRAYVAGSLAVIMLIMHSMIWGVTLFSGWYETREVAFQSSAFVIGVSATIIGFFIARGSGIRRNTGVALASILAVAGYVVPVLIFLGIATGIWWPIIQEILSSPLQAVWLIPVGFLGSGLAFFIQSLIYSVLVLPLVALSGWLLKES